MRLLTPWHR